MSVTFRYLTKIRSLLRLQYYHIKNGVTTSYYIQGSISLSIPLTDLWNFHLQ